MTNTDPFANIPNVDDSLNGEFSPAKAAPAPKAEAEANWSLLRGTVERDLASAKARSKRTGDYADNQAYTYQLVLDSMDVLEFGLEHWRSKMEADPEFVPLPESVPGLAEHTQAACDTIKAASDVTV